MTRESGIRTAVFIDRDGVINRKAPEGDYIRRWADFEFAPGSVAALRMLVEGGGVVLVVTNQRGVARGLVDPRDLDDIHTRMSTDLCSVGVEIGGVYVCPHEQGTCDCRKPDVGLFLRARAEHPWIDFSASHLVGDSVTDLMAGYQLGMRLWLVGDDKARRRVVGQAAEQGIELAGEAQSLLGLVEHAGLLSSVAGARFGSVSAATQTRD